MNGWIDGKMERGREINEEIISGWRGGKVGVQIKE